MRHGQKKNEKRQKVKKKTHIDKEDKTKYKTDSSIIKIGNKEKKRGIYRDTWQAKWRQGVREGKVKSSSNS